MTYFIRYLDMEKKLSSRTLVERKPGMFKKIFNCSGYIENIYDELIKLDKEGLIKIIFISK